MRKLISTDQKRIFGARAVNALARELRAVGGTPCRACPYRPQKE